MVRRTTIEIDQELLERAKKALGRRTTRATVEEALRLAADGHESSRERLAESQRRYLADLAALADVEVLRSEHMWR